MNREEVDTFLAAYGAGSIARSAQELCIEQGTASKRIAQLEAELSVRLFYRSRGVRRTTLTPEGEAFLPIAQRMSSLFAEAEALRETRARLPLGIASTHSVMTYHLAGFLREYVQRHPEVELTVHTEHSTEALALVDTQRADVALVTSLHAFPGVVAKPLFREPLVVLHHGDAAFAHTGERADLDPEREVYLPFSREYDIWHRNVFPEAGGHHKVSVGTLSAACEFLDAPDGWCIATQAMAEAWATGHPDWRWNMPSWLPEPRTIYLARHKNPLPGKDEACAQLVEELEDYLIIAQTT